MNRSTLDVLPASLKPRKAPLLSPNTKSVTRAATAVDKQPQQQEANPAMQEKETNPSTEQREADTSTEQQETNPSTSQSSLMIALLEDAAIAPNTNGAQPASSAHSGSDSGKEGTTFATAIVVPADTEEDEETVEDTAVVVAAPPKRGGNANPHFPAQFWRRERAIDQTDKNLSSVRISDTPTGQKGRSPKEKSPLGPKTDEHPWLGADKDATMRVENDQENATNGASKESQSFASDSRQKMEDKAVRTGAELWRAHTDEEDALFRRKARKSTMKALGPVKVRRRGEEDPDSPTQPYHPQAKRVKIQSCSESQLRVRHLPDEAPPKLGPYQYLERVYVRSTSKEEWYPGQVTGQLKVEMTQCYQYVVRFWSRLGYVGFKAHASCACRSCLTRGVC